MRRFTIYAVDTDNGLISGVSDDNLELGNDDMHVATDGDISPTFVARMINDPTYRFTSSELGVILGTILDGAEGPFLSFSTKVDRYMRQIQNKGTRTAGATHVRVASASGLLIADSLNIPNNAPATIDLIAHNLSPDGIVHPWIVTNSVSLPASPGLVNKYTLGCVSINGVQVTDLEEVTVDFGFDLTSDPSDKGLPNPQFKAIQTYQPTIRIRTKDALVLDTFGPGVLAIDANDVVIEIRQIQQDGTRWPDINVPPKHITITVDEGVVNIPSGDSGQGEQNTAEIQVLPVFDGVNDVIAIAVGVDL